MKTSPNGVRFIAAQEAAVLVAYQDGAHFSIGFGHNSAALRSGDRVTLDEAVDLFRKDLVEREVTIERQIQNLKQNEFDALVSLTYNSGNKVFGVIGKLRVGDPDGAMVALMGICTAAGKFRMGLAKRRLKEAAIFLNADYGDTAKIKVWKDNPRTSQPVEMDFPELS